MPVPPCTTGVTELEADLCDRYDDDSLENSLGSWVTGRKSRTRSTPYAPNTRT